MTDLAFSADDVTLRDRARELFLAHRQKVYERTDRVFAALMLIQWAALVMAARWISPHTSAISGQSNEHVWLAATLGGVLCVLPLACLIESSGRSFTRHAFCISQVLFTALFIHFTGGRFESHHHLFGSLAVIAIYRDWRVLASATLVVVGEQCLGGVYSSQSIYFGSSSFEFWQWSGQIGWLLFEDFFLILIIASANKEMFRVTRHTAELELANDQIEKKIEQRTDELQQAINAAEQASIAKSQFLANISHEIRTPMNGIIGITDLLLVSSTDKEQLQNLELIQSSAASLMAVLNDVLDFSSMESDKFVLDREPFDLQQLIGDTMKMFGLQAHRKGIELVHRARVSVPRIVVGDALRLRQILVNLIGNSLKFTEKGEIFISVEVEHEYEDAVVVRFAVEDTGIGISEEQKQAIFSPFIQADGSSTRQYGGAGLGLTISQKLVGLMGGTMELQSELGKGSCFQFTAKFNRPAAEDAVEISPVDRERLHGLEVLVADDSANNRLILEEILAGWNMVPTVVSSGAAAIELIESRARKQKPFPVMLLDAEMPEVDGFDVAERVQEIWEDADRSVILMLAAADSDNAVERCRQIGIASHVFKPVHQWELVNTILSVIARGDLSSSHSGNDTSETYRILLAEDNCVNQQLMVGVLEKSGHNVTIATNGQQAVDAYRLDQTYDVILMDVQMPVMDGMEATKAIRKLEQATSSHVPIIALTAHAMKGDRERFLESGMDNYISKPIQIAELRTTIAHAVRSNKTEPECTTETNASTIETTDNPIVDVSGLMDRVAQDFDLLSELVSTFRTLYPTYIREIEDALGSEEQADLLEKVHSLKGLASNLGGVQSVATVESMEQLARDADFIACRDRMVKLESSLKVQLDALDQLLECNAVS
ncbi:MAG: response regulator [Planctomycetales bacterium]|nr:response regulator [Planctomycetales bacterium]